jgi:ubiquinone/menaquinone biosynthesis C-methylase UbiE
LDYLRHRQSNQAFIRENDDFKAPPLRLAYDAYHTVDWRHYHQVGASQAAYFVSLFNKWYKGQEKSIRLLDWGCGPGRIIKHLSDYSANGGAYFECYGTDYNKKTIKWCKNTFKDINFSLNKASPPLPFDENFFSVVISRSVFTHLSKTMHHLWVRELYRVANISGLLIVTTHGNNFIKKMSAHESTEFVKGNLVVRGNAKEGKKAFTAFHPAEAVRSVFTPYFDIMAHIEKPECKGLVQDVWVMRKKKIEGRSRPEIGCHMTEGEKGHGEDNDTVQ